MLPRCERFSIVYVSPGTWPSLPLWSGMRHDTFLRVCVYKRCCVFPLLCLLFVCLPASPKARRLSLISSSLHLLSAVSPFPFIPPLFPDLHISQPRSIPYFQDLTFSYSLVIPHNRHLHPSPFSNYFLSLQSYAFSCVLFPGDPPDSFPRG